MPLLKQRWPIQPGVFNHVVVDVHGAR
jgi:hypothetical protein